MSQPPFRIEQKDGKDTIFDRVRKKWVFLSPEEWVRQQFLHYLIEVKHFPSALISVEKQLKLGQKVRRYDIVVYKQDIPWLLVECKQEQEVLSPAVLQQILSYNSLLKVAYLVITNGHEVYCYSVQEAVWSRSVPDWQEAGND
ncbi:MAG TPA: type I restriction enzyme HsdR N-terminal domain-containing protein [Chitinophagaceae bacterium]|nr:type I restriction enzyme HsdR N-terminal domain-containing protein [Chitinophagaceae bacterium]